MSESTREPAAPIRVLVVDDHAMFTDALALLIGATNGIEACGTAGSAEEALELARASCPDVVLMDVELPGIDGIEATRRIREICPQAEVIAITALQPDKVLAAMVDAGASGFVPKTQAADRLIPIIRAAAEGEMVLPRGEVAPLLRRLQAVRDVRSEVRDRLGQLTDREVQVLQAIADGKSTEEIGEALYISPYTVHGHVRSILPKLGVRSKLEAVLYALRNGAITLQETG